MAKICYKKAESLIRPSEIDTTSSSDGVFIRENIEAVEVMTESEESIVKYVYDEAFLTHGEYESFKNSQYKDTVSEALNSLTLRRESEIIDEYTLQLMEEGII